MRLSWKINLVLILVFCVALGLQAASAVVRETDLFEREMQRDHEVMGSSLRHAVDDAWRIGGTDAAQRLVPHLDAEDQGVRVRWIELGVGSGQPADLPDAATTALASGVVTSVIAAGPAGPAGPARPLGAGLPARPLAAGLPARPLAAGFRYTYVPLDAPHAALEFRESLAEQRRYVASSGIRLAGWLVVLVIATSAAVGWLVRVLVGRPVDQLIAHAGRVGDGDLGSRAGLASADELGDLGRALDAMAGALRDAQVERERALDQLRHADRLMTVGKLAAGVAHELGTPLNVALARTRMIERWEVDDVPDARDNARIVADQCQRMARIIRQLLDCARPRPAERAPADLRAVVDDAVSLLAPDARHRSVALVSVPGPPVIAAIDRAQLHQVALNLVGNALQATPAGGAVTVTVEARGDQVRLAVRDDGTGIAPEHLPHLFEPFFTTKDVGEGTGLGLSVSHGIVREHGGTIAVDSAPGRGTEFRVDLPVGDIASCRAAS